MQGRDQIYFDVPQNREERSASEMEESSVRDSDHERSSAHSSDIIVTTADKQDLIVSVRELAEADGSRKMTLSISNLRPETAFGKIQGDHVTAYQCLLEMLMVAVDGQPLRLCAEMIADTAKSILPDKSEQFNNILAIQITHVESIITPEERHELVGSIGQQNTKNRLDHSLKLARRAAFRQMVEQISETFIREVNLDEHTAFVRIGAMDRSQGARVKRAIHSLKVINDLLSIIRTLSNTTRESEQLLEKFYKNYIQTNARYKDGANKVFGVANIASLNSRWNGMLLSGKALALQALHEELMTSNNWVKTISSCFGYLFDFSYDTHKDKESVAEILFEVTAKHIVVMLRAFPCFLLFENSTKEAIINNFINDCVLEHEGWSQLLLEGEENEEEILVNTTVVKAEVLKLLNFAECRMLSETEILAQTRPRLGLLEKNLVANQSLRR